MPATACSCVVDASTGDVTVLDPHCRHPLHVMENDLIKDPIVW